MRVMVTGHYGYIGSILVPMLIEAGHDVVGLDSNLFERSLYGGWRWPEIRTIHTDIRDVTEADLAGCEAVLHLAGMCHDPLGALMTAQATKSGVQGKSVSVRGDRGGRRIIKTKN